MNKFTSLKKSWFSFLALSTIISVNPAQAALVNGGFEDGFNNWAKTGDTSIQDSSFGSGPTELNHQALLTNSALFDFDGLNFSGEDPLYVGFAGGLEDFLGLPLGVLDDPDNFVFATEGSAIKRNITVKSGDILTLDWNFLTDDIQDYGFIALWEINDLSNFTYDDLVIIDNNTGVSTSTTPFTSETGYQTYSHTFGSGGTYSLGFGVVDTFDVAVSSGLLIDNVQLTQTETEVQVPEHSSLISFLLLGVLGVSSLCKVNFK